MKTIMRAGAPSRLGMSVMFVALVLVSVPARVCAQIPDEYEITAVIVAPCGGDDFSPTVGAGITGDDVVAGYYRSCEIGPEIPFIWTDGGGIVEIPMPADFIQGRAFGIDGSLVVGFADIANDKGFSLRAFVYNIDSGALEIINPPEGGGYTWLLAVSGSSAVGNWGGGVFGNPTSEAFIWEDGVFTSLAPDLGTSESRAQAISAGGLVTGWMGESSPSFDGNAYIWHEGEVTKLPVIPDGFTSDGRAINEHGDVAGSGVLFDKDVAHAFAYIDGVMHVIPPLPGWERSFGQAIADNGMVGGSSQSLGSEAFLWYQGKTVRLGDLIDPGAGMELDSVKEIRPDGTILCDGLTTLNGRADQNVTVILTPIFPPLGDLNDDGFVNGSDLIILLGAWGRCPGDCPADLDGDGVVGTGDLILLLGNWG